MTTSTSITSGGRPCGARPRSAPAVAGALESELEQALDERVVVQPGGLPEPGVGAGRGEPGNGVDLVDEGAVALEEEIDPGHPGAVDGPEGSHGQLSQSGRDLGRHRSGDGDAGLPLRVLGRVVVPL